LPDIVDPQTRSRMMAGIRGKNTKPEMLVRKALHARGFRYRLHSSNAPGHPDLLLPKYRAVIFVHGCFWHGHDCPAVKVPGTRTDFWVDKILRNRDRDREVTEALLLQNWRRATVWECAMRGHGKLDFDAMIDCIAGWLMSGQVALELRGKA
jgi:DNA mismatch endonuclease (patch repair protein)